MKRTWYHRMLLSYLPIYLFITSIIILMTFLMISRMSQKEAENANRMYVDQQVQALDRSLQGIDNMLIKEIQRGEDIVRFFDKEKDPTYLQSYETSEKLNQLKSTDPLIDSLYLYRFSDRMIMSPNMMISVDKFGDQRFADSFLDKPDRYTLSTERTFSEFIDTSAYPTRVISIARKFPLLGGSQGVIVVNISIPKLQKWVEEMSRSERSFYYILDNEGKMLVGHSRASPKKGSELSRVKSEYTGWEFVGGVLDGHLYQFASVLIYIWIICGLIVIGFLWIMFVTRRNYKPIETILDRIHHYSMQKSSKLTLEKDEFKFIDQALEALIERSQTYQKLHEEDVDIRRRQLLNDMTEGNRIFSAESWPAEAPAYQLPVDFQRIAMAVIEIDRFSFWCQSYNRRDQYLLKFVLSSVVKETAETNQAGVWSEWIANHRLAVVYFLKEGQDHDLSGSLAEQVRAWVEVNLDFTVTIGLSGSDGGITELAQLHDEAIEALSYKGSIGINKILTPPYSHSPGEPYKHLQNIRNLTQTYRLLEPKWRDMFQILFAEIRQDLLNREEHANLLNFLLYQFNKELSGLSPDIVERWTSSFLPRLSDAIERFDFMDELQANILEILEDMEAGILALRENRSNSVQARNIRRYIKENHSNPDLSLNHLCDQFGLNGKYISRMFKEEFGEKLVDYMVSVRIEKSKELLNGTSLSVQDIAQAVGYVHDISFIRAFKKVVGRTPGEYRKG
jgi:two-component system, response regulator YesN